MTSPLRLTFARLCVDTRTMLDITQQVLADAVGVSRAHISAIEMGRANPTLDLAARIAHTLGIELDFVARRPLVIGARQQHDAVHARCSGYVDRRLRRAAWDVRREVEVIHGRHHGWIDLLAFDLRTGTVLIIELKTRVDDLGAIERQLGWYERSALSLARRFDWRPRHIAGWLIVLATDEVDTAIRANKEALAPAFPMRAAEMMRVAGGDMPPGRSSRGIALIDPSQPPERLVAQVSLGRTPHAGAVSALRASRPPP